MNLYVIEAHRLTPDNTLAKELQYVVARSFRSALDWVTSTGTPEEEIIGIRCACPVVAIVSDDANAAQASQPPQAALRKRLEQMEIEDRNANV